MKHSGQKLVALLVLLAGIANIASAFFSRTFWMIVARDLTFMEIINTSRTLTIIAGIFLIFLAKGIWQRKRRAWQFTTVIVGASIFLHIVKGSGWIDFSLLLGIFALLLSSKAQYTIASGRWFLSERISIAFFFFISIMLYSIVGYYLLQSHFAHPVTLQAIGQDYLYTVTGIGKQTLAPKTRKAVWFEDSILTISLVLFVSIFAALFGPSLIPLQELSEEEREKLRKLILLYSKNTIHYFALMSDKQYFFSAFDRCAISYKIRNGTAVVLGEPIGPIEEHRSCIQGFVNTMQQHGLSTAFIFIREEQKELFELQHFDSLLIAEEAVIPTNTFTTQGSDMKNIRNAVSHIAKEQVVFSWYTMDEIPWGVMTQIETLHDEWLASKPIGGLTFAVDFYPFPPEKEGHVLVMCNHEGNALGFLSFFPSNQGTGVVIDMLIHKDDAPNGLVDAAIVQSIEHFRSLGKETVSLGGVPLAGQTLQYDKRLAVLRKYMGRFYNYNSLFTFKNKFKPVWLKRYMAYPSKLELPKIALAIIQVLTKENIIKTLLGKRND